jgi:hypothetical protein
MFSLFKVHVPQSLPKEAVVYETNKVNNTPFFNCLISVLKVDDLI